MRRSLICWIVAGFLSAVAPAQTNEGWSLTRRVPNHPQPHFLNQLLHAGGSHSASHAEHIQARIWQPREQSQVPIEFEWLGEPLPGRVSDQATKPLETFEFD
jgi:hypothetical protein